MSGYQKDRQRLVDNVQKELMSNYYLHKYNSLMNKVPTPSETETFNQYKSKPRQTDTNRLNFKNMILLKKNQNSNYSSSKNNNQESKTSQIRGQLKLTQSEIEEQQNTKTARKLQESIINQLYRPSPSKLQEGHYHTLQINGLSKYRQMSANKFQLQPIPTQNIQITYQEQHLSDEDNSPQKQTEEKHLNQIRQAIKMQFSRREERSASPKKNSPKKRDCSSGNQSSHISVQIKIQSPKKSESVMTPNRYSQKHKSFKKQSKQSINQGKQSDNEQDKVEAKVHFSRQFTPELNQILHQPEAYKSEEVHFVHDEDIQFVLPSSNYYKSNNQNLVEDSFRFNERTGSQNDKLSERERSINSQNQREQSLHKQESKKTLKSGKGQNQKSQAKESSQFQMSFVSRMSMLSSEQGLHIKQNIEKELYQNQLGPYQSALYGVLQLIEQFPRTGPIYAVGQKTLDDRKTYQSKRQAQQTQISQYRKQIDKLKKRSQAKPLQGDDQTIRLNKLQILRLIRKISTKL